MNAHDREDRKQFLDTAYAKARVNYHPDRHGNQSAYIRAALKHAGIDWDRRQRVERHKQSRTRSLESLLSEPAIPDPVTAFDTLELAMFLLRKLPEHERGIISAMYLGAYSRAEIATALQVSAQTVSRIRKTAIKRLRRHPK